MAPTADRYKEIQRALIEKGYLEEPATGVWGPASVEALKRFQKDQNLEPDGKLYPVTKEDGDKFMARGLKFANGDGAYAATVRLDPRGDRGFRMVDDFAEQTRRLVAGRVERRLHHAVVQADDHLDRPQLRRLEADLHRPAIREELSPHGGNDGGMILLDEAQLRQRRPRRGGCG